MNGGVDLQTLYLLCAVVGAFCIMSIMWHHTIFENLFLADAKKLVCHAKLKIDGATRAQSFGNTHTHITQFISHFFRLIGANLCSPQLVAQSIKYYDVICMWNSLISLRFSVFFSFFSSSVYLLKLAWVLCTKCELWLSFQIDAIT